MTNPSIASDRADWLLDAIAGATQDRRFLRGDTEYDEVIGDAILLNGEKAITVALSQLTREVDELREALHKIADDPYRYGIRVQKMKLIASEALSSSSGGAQ